MKNRQQRLPRSYLFVPGDRPDRFDKALATGADMVILDLEDAVAPAQKPQASEAVAGWLTPEHSICLRINGPDTDWFEDDLKLASATGVVAIMVPKIETTEQIKRVVSGVQGKIPVLPFIETAAGYWNIQEIAGTSGVQRLVFGTLDFLMDMGMSAQGDELNSVRLQMVLVSRLADLAAPVEGVTQDIENTNILRADSLRARSLGFGGKLCIHPAQVNLVNDCFSHTEAEIAWARKVVAAAVQSNGAVVVIEGKMIDKPVIERARLILGQTRE